jgi:hypothetical protein
MLFTSDSIFLNRLKALFMAKEKVLNPGNLCRKMKRGIKTSPDAASFEKNILTPEYDLYLREGCSGAIYTNLFDKVAKKALEFKVTVKPGFGVKAIVILPDLVQMAVAAGTFNVRRDDDDSYKE